MESREEKESQGKILWKIFISTLYLSAFTFGGGYVIVTLMKKKFVDEYHWIGEDEMLDLVAIAQSSPGAIAVNGAIVVGYKLVGIPGALVAILGTILPPFVIIAAISVCYNVFRSNFFVAQMLSGMQAGVGAVIASVTYDMGAPIVKEKDPMSLVIMLGAFLAACILEINVVYIVIVCGLIGLVRTLLSANRNVQLRRRLCGHASDPGTSSHDSRMADHVGIHGSDHDITDNTGPHCSEFRHLRGTEDCRDSRSCGGNGRVYSAVLHYCDDPGKTIPEVS